MAVEGREVRSGGTDSGAAASASTIGLACLQLVPAPTGEAEDLFLHFLALRRAERRRLQEEKRSQLGRKLRQAVAPAGAAPAPSPPSKRAASSSSVQLQGRPAKRRPDLNSAAVRSKLGEAKASSRAFAADLDASIDQAMQQQSQERIDRAREASASLRSLVAANGTVRGESPAPVATRLEEPMASRPDSTSNRYAPSDLWEGPPETETKVEDAMAHARRVQDTLMDLQIKQTLRELSNLQVVLLTSPDNAESTQPENVRTRSPETPRQRTRAGVQTGPSVVLTADEAAKEAEAAKDAQETADEAAKEAEAAKDAQETADEAAKEAEAAKDTQETADEAAKEAEAAKDAQEMADEAAKEAEATKEEHLDNNGLAPPSLLPPTKWDGYLWTRVFPWLLPPRNGPFAFLPSLSFKPMAWAPTLRLVLTDGTLGELRDHQVKALSDVIDGKLQGSMRIAGDLLPSFPGCVVYIAWDNSILPVVVAKVGAMRTAGLLAEDAAVARRPLSPLAKFPDYDQLADFRNALSGGPSICIRCLGDPDDYSVYVNSRGDVLPVVVPVTASVFARLVMHLREGGSGPLKSSSSPHDAGLVSQEGLAAMKDTMPPPSAEELDALRAAMDAGPKPGAMVEAPVRNSMSTNSGPKKVADATSSWSALAEVAQKLRGVYHKGHAFPAWAVDKLAAGELEKSLRSVVVYHASSDDADLVKALIREREPVNIEMRRLYSEKRLEDLFGYTQGAYSKSTPDKLMPNIAAYCQTPIRIGTQECVAHVINSIGYGFDSTTQPDYKYFFPMTPEKWKELTDRMKCMWRFIFECAQRHSLSKVYLCDVGGGHFARLLNEKPETQWSILKDNSLPAVTAQYPSIQVHSLHELSSTESKIFLDRLAGDAKSSLSDSLLVNAWDPWTFVGNGNSMDQSLDGKFGRNTPMAVLCSPWTNPFIKYDAV